MGADLPRQLFERTSPSEAQKLVRLSKRLPIQRCRRILERCLDLSAAEIAHRLTALVRREQARTIEPAPSFVLPRAAVVDALAKRHAPGCEATSSMDAPALARLRAIAERTRAGSVVTFGRSIHLDPATFDWQRDPVTERRLWADVPLDEGGAVRATRSEDGAPLTDVKYVWELSRHQPLAVVSYTGRVDADPAAVAYVASSIDGWTRQNPPGRGVNWSSTLEVGLRALSWLSAMACILGNDAVGDELATRWIGALVAHYDHLRRHLSIYTDRSNHLIGEATALWVLATTLPELPEARREAGRALDVLTTEIERQVSPDGVSREQATGYHCFVLDFYLQIVAGARRLDLALPPIVESRSTAMLDFVDRLLGAGGDLPQIGDGDDGVGIPLLSVLEPRERAETLLAVGARLFDRPHWLPDGAIARGMANVVLGAAPAASALRHGGERRRDVSIALRDGGYCFLEAVRDDGHARQLVFDVGSLGHLPNAAHEHADALGILVRVGRTLVLADPGTGTYTASPAIRNLFRGTAAHNTITVDDLDQADVLDTFKWVNLTRTELLDWSASASLDYVAAYHDGYTRLREPVRHTREVLFVRPFYWILVDRVEGSGVHRIARRFHFAPEVEVAQRDAATFDATAATTGDGLRLVFFDPGCVSPITTRVEPGPWSPGYGRWETSTRITMETTSSAPCTFLALLVPLRDGQADVTIDRAEAQGTPDVVCRIAANGVATPQIDRVMTHERDNVPGRGFRFVRRTGSEELTRLLGCAPSRA